MLTQIEQFDLTQILQPAQEPGDARQDAVVWGPNLTVTRGSAVGVKTSDRNAYPMVPGAGDGTQTFVGFAMYSFVTDANGMVFYGPTATTSFRTGPWKTSPIWKNGIFDPAILLTKPTTVAGEVDTFTPANVANGNTYTLTYTDPAGQVTAVTYTATGTDTVGTVSVALINLWNADPTLGSVATASGTVTVVLTAANTGHAFNVASSAAGGTATLTKVVTTAAVGFALADILPGAPGARILHNGFLFVP